LKSRSSKWIIFAPALVLSLGYVLAAANSILIPEVELGAGVAEKPDCISEAVVDFEISTQGTLTGINVSPVGLDCNGQWIRLSLFQSSDGSGTASEQVVWQVPISSQSITSFTLRTNGTTTGTVGSIIWPSNEAGAAGRAAEPIEASTINSFLLETSESALTDGP